MKTRLPNRTTAKWVTRILIAGFVLSGICDFGLRLAAAAKKEGLQVVTAMINAHGGMKTWRAAPTVTFQDEFVPAGAASGLPSRVTVEQTSRRAYLDFPGTDMRISWDGKRAWSENWNLPYPPRFLALLNYYFLNLPWLTMDPGVNLKPEGKKRLWDDPVEYIAVRMTFDPGVGDTPDDYYLLYIHPETKMLKACDYVVTYKSLLPEGAKMTPEHILVFDEYADVDGLKVPVRYTIYETDRKLYAKCNVKNWSFSEPFEAARMTMPAGAVIDESTP